jgi:Cation transport ATPase
MNGTLYRLGSPAFIEETARLDVATKARIDTLRHEAKTVIILATDSYMGLLAISDDVKEGAKKAITDLRAQGIETVMVTGDHQKTAEAIARKVGINIVHASVLPGQKLDIVKESQKEGAIAFVGDGINDAPALTQADLGIAMGGGTDIAIEAGQIVIIGGDIRKVPQALKMSSRTYRTIKQNLFWAFIYNAIGIPLAALGLLNPMIAAGAMAFSSISVLLNSLRLKRQ